MPRLSTPTLTSLLRALFDSEQWRRAGRAEYRFATNALRWVGGSQTMLRWAISMLCLTVAVLGAGMQFHPYGPHGPLMRTIQVVVLISALVVGVLWVSLPWPSYRVALAFAVWADVAITVGAAVLSSPEARLLATIHMGMVGLFVGFLLGWRVLLVHCGFCVLVITALTVWGIHDGMSASLLYVIVAPALSTVVGIPMMVQAVVEGGRIGLRRITGQSLLDPLTKLLNRRGLDEYTKSLTARVDPPHWLASSWSISTVSNGSTTTTVMVAATPCCGGPREF